MAKHYSMSATGTETTLAEGPRESFHRPVVEAVAGLVACVLLSVLLVMAGHGTTSLGGAGFFGLLFGVFVAFSFDRLGWDRAAGAWDLRRLGIVALVAVVAAPVLEALTLFGSPYHSVVRLEDWSATQTCLWGCVAYFFVAGGAVVADLGVLRKPRATPRQVGTGALAVAGAVLLSAVLAALLGPLVRISFLELWLFASALLVSGGLVVFGALHRWPVERLFVAACLGVGLLIAVLAPAKTWVSWDDETHFPRTVALSYLMNPAYTESEERLRTDLPGLYVGTRDPVDPDPEYRDEVDDIEQSLDEGYRNNAYELPGTNAPRRDDTISIVRPPTVGYAPAAIGLWVGRLLHLSFSAIVACGRISSILCYAAMVFVAIRLAPSKKALMACVALLPTCVFLAASYSYDGLIIATALIGCSLVLRASLSDRKVSWWTLIAIATCFALTCAPKMVYFPLFGLLLVIPEDKFPSKKIRRAVILGAVVLAVCVAAAFLLPYIVQGFGQGDTRGGSDVNAAEQVNYILGHPLEFVGMLGNFLVNTYLNPATSSGYAFSFAYLSDLPVVLPFLGSIPAILLVSTALLDSDRRTWPLARNSIRLWSLLLFVGSVVMIASALYINFTPVANDTVLGCQPRYLLPILFLPLAFILNFKIDNDRTARALGNFTTITMGGLGLVSCWLLVVSAAVI